MAKKPLAGIEPHILASLDSFSQVVSTAEKALEWVIAYQKKESLPDWVQQDLEELIEILEEIQH